MQFTQEFMKAVETELKRTGVTVELEGGKGTFDIENIGDSKITIQVTIESDAVSTKAISKLNK